MTHRRAPFEVRARDTDSLLAGQKVYGQHCKYPDMFQKRWDVILRQELFYTRKRFKEKAVSKIIRFSFSNTCQKRGSFLPMAKYCKTLRTHPLGFHRDIDNFNGKLTENAPIFVLWTFASDWVKKIPFFETRVECW